MSLIRSALEFYFIFKCLVTDGTYVNLFIDTDTFKRGKLLLKISNNLKYIIPNIEKNLDSDLKDKLTNNIKKIQVSQWAEIANEKILYDLDYDILSNYVHPDIRTLEQYLI